MIGPKEVSLRASYYALHNYLSVATKVKKAKKEKEKERFKVFLPMQGENSPAG